MSAIDGRYETPDTITMQLDSQHDLFVRTMIHLRYYILTGA